MIVGDTFDAVAEFVKEYSVGLVVDPTNLSDLADMIRAVDYRQLKTNVLKARQLLSLEQNISKLINLIDDAIVYHKNKVLESV